MANELATFDPIGSFVGSFQKSRGAEQEFRRRKQELDAQPQRNQLAQIKLDTAQQGLVSGAREAQKASALDSANFLVNASKALLGVPLQQRAAAAQSLLPQAQQAGIDIKGFDPSQPLTDEALGQGILSANTLIQSLQGGRQAPSALDQARTAKTIRETELLGDPGSFKREEFEFKKQVEERQKTKLSASVEKALLDSQDSIVKANRNASEFDILADQVEAAAIGGGAKASTSETFKALLGTQDDVTELRRRFNSVRLSEGLKNLPPGPATDKDMEQAFKGVPPENAPASQIASFLRGAAKMARFDAGYNMFKSDFISDKSNTRGLNKEWRSSVTSSVLGRSITIAEIYAESAAEGMTPEDVKAELGIE